MDKIQIYMASNKEEYDKAIAWVRDHGYDDDIREVGEPMHATDWLGNPLDAFIFLFTGPNVVMSELTEYMNVDSIPLSNYLTD